MTRPATRVTGTRDALVRLLAPVLAEVGLDMEDIEISSAGKRRLIRVVVDRDGGVSLDDVATASHDLSRRLDEDPALEAALGRSSYVLEVTSPGIGRPLTEPRHWRRATGRLVSAELSSGGVVTGRVSHVGHDGVVLDVDGVPQARRFVDLRRGRVHVEFAPASGPPDQAPDHASDQTGGAGQGEPGVEPRHEQGTEG